jgi:CSLREA domain-containing protein
MLWQLPMRAIRFAIAGFPLLILAVGVSSPLAAKDSLAAPPPLGVALVVNTPLDNEVDDADCSLREAIIATNNETYYFGCDASQSEQGATDYIVFNIGAGTPVINITSSLPLISDKLNIQWEYHCGSSRAARWRHRKRHLLVVRVINQRHQRACDQQLRYRHRCDRSQRVHPR